ncbi:MAG: hypothetical protein V4654_00175 [Bdellovibrionota bacterium]
MIKTILLLLGLILSASVSHAEFGMLSTRYITAYDFQNRLNSMFFDVYAQSPTLMIYGKCRQGLAQFGFTSPANGKPFSQFPNSETVKTIQTCYTESFTFTLAYLLTANQKNYINFLSQFIPEAILQQQLANQSPMNSWHSGSIQSLTPAEQDLLIAQTVETMLGIDEVILSYGIIKDVNAYRAFLKTKIKANQSIFDVITGLTKELALRNEFLTY